MEFPYEAPNDEVLERIDCMMCPQIRDWYVLHPYNLISTRLVTDSGSPPKFFQLARMKTISFEELPNIANDERRYLTLMELTENQIELLMKNPAQHANKFDRYTFVYVELKRDPTPSQSIHVFLSALSEKGSKYHVAYESTQLTVGPIENEDICEVLSSISHFHL